MTHSPTSPYPTSALRAAVIGCPVAHSLSPVIHNFWLKEHGLAGEYGRIEVQPESLEDFLKNLWGTGMRGVNITIPHKETAFALLRQWSAHQNGPALRAHADTLHQNAVCISDTAQQVCAVNTLVLREDGTLYADNTDVEGFRESMKASFARAAYEGATAMVWGAGGASRGVILALKQLNVTRVLLLNRTVERAQALAQQYDSPEMPVEAHALDSASALLPRVQLLVNSTSIGLDDSATVRADFPGLHAGLTVVDIVYHAGGTPLVNAARAAGLPCIDGLAMLLYQAVPGFEMWFGVRPQVSAALWQAVHQATQAKRG